MTNHDEPSIVPERAPLPRDELGPFLVLGVDKDADQEQIDAQRDRRISAARNDKTGVPLQDVNWAREVLNDPGQRVKADVTSLNIDTTERTLRGLEEAFGLADQGLAWLALDVEKPLADYSPAAEIPDPEALRQAIALPTVPRDVPAVAALLADFARLPLDPWALDAADSSIEE